ncbi:MAG: cell envelope integrity protein TolA [Cyclobacteriaceae bacterium]|nr:cell envelope integrity protein TolA [Cyclobacteriaceae bacterium]
MTVQQEQKNKRIALVVSIGFHAVLLIAFLLLMAWRAPNPPLPEYGVELNFGLDQQGGGEVQPDKAPGTQNDTPDPREEQAQEVAKEQPVQAEPEKAEEPIVSKLESPVVVKEEKKEPVKEPIKENKTETKPKVTPKEEVKKEEPKEVVKTEYKPAETKPAEKKGDGGTSHGDDPGKVGDKGNPEGKLDSKALYGQQGGGGGGNGFGLSMAGWAWADEPKIPDLPDNQDGRIEFEIECDEDGEIVGITTLHRGLSARAEQLLKDEIRRNSLMKTSAGQAPSRSKGRVVFILKTK